MAIPDMEDIAKVMLVRNGFTDNSHKKERLSKVVVSMFDKLKNSLGKRCHYDFGMRMLKTVIGYAAYLKKQDTNNLNELDIVLLSLKKAFSKSFLHQDDMRLAEQILGELEHQPLEDILKVRHGVVILTKTQFTTKLGLLPENKCK